MKWKKPLATENDIESAVAENVSKLNFGNGLQLRVHKKGYKYFQLRICLDDKDRTVQLGKYPEMKLAHAQEKAAQYRAEIAKVRTQRAELAFRTKLKKLENESRFERFSVFKKIEDAAQFIRNLRTGPDWNSEVGQALLLQLLIPARWNDIIRAQSAHFNLPLRQWTVSQRRAGRGDNGPVHFSIAYFSQDATAAVAKCLQSTANEKYLFPALASMSKSDLANAVANVMHTTWPDYPVDPEGIPFFFKAMANQHSYFRPELIEHTVSHKSGPKAGYRLLSYILQRRALADWWCNELLMPPELPHFRSGII